MQIYSSSSILRPVSPFGMWVEHRSMTALHRLPASPLPYRILLRPALLHPILIPCFLNNSSSTLNHSSSSSPHSLSPSFWNRIYSEHEYIFVKNAFPWHNPPFYIPQIVSAKLHPLSISEPTFYIISQSTAPLHHSRSLLYSHSHSHPYCSPSHSHYTPPPPPHQPPK